MLKEKSFNFSFLLKMLCWWIIWRLLIQLIAILAPIFLEYQPSFPYYQSLEASNFPKSIYSWANFDGVHYLIIADYGYKLANLIQAFFPVFPLLMRFFTLITKNSLISGLIISSVSSFGCIFYGYKVAQRWFDKNVAKHFILIMLTFPTSFYLGALYNESLFLMLLLAGSWYSLTDKKLISGVLIGLSSGVRLVGLMLIPSLLLKLIHACCMVPKQRFIFLKKTLRKKWKFIIGLMAGSVAFLLFVLYLYNNFGDPLYFFSVQSDFGTGRQTNLVFPLQSFYRSLMMLFTVRPIDWKYFSYVQDFVISSLVFTGIIFSWKKIPIEYWIFSFISFFLPIVTGNLSSMPRYSLILFPILIWWASLISTRKKLAILYYATSTILLVINITLFIQGYWVA